MKTRRFRKPTCPIKFCRALRGHRAYRYLPFSRLSRTCPIFFPTPRFASFATQKAPRTSPSSPVAALRWASGRHHLGREHVFGHCNLVELLRRKGTAARAQVIGVTTSGAYLHLVREVRHSETHALLRRFCTRLRAASSSWQWVHTCAVTPHDPPFAQLP